MKHDDSFKIIGKTVVLVPYRKEHVVKYHDWMADDEILRLTGSERLSLEEEYSMQKTWEADSDKCTFIILNKQYFEESGDEIKSMIGDTNLFFNHNDPNEAEIEIMIAEKSSRRKGCAKDALQQMIQFGNENLHLKKYIAKIKDDNAPSKTLFNALGFKEVSHSVAFSEVTLELVIT